VTVVAGLGLVMFGKLLSIHWYQVGKLALEAVPRSVPGAAEAGANAKSKSLIQI
jgi:hypothetical protein